jgi:CspA family cold shock protein
MMQSAPTVAPARRYATVVCQTFRKSAALRLVRDSGTRRITDTRGNVKSAGHASAVFLLFSVSRNRILAVRPLRTVRGDRYGSTNQDPSCGADCSDCKPSRNLKCDETRRPTMQKGTVKWFNPTKGYGFIRPATGDKDVFVHISAVERAGLNTLNEGQTVEYELVTGRNGKTSAENLKVG